MGAKTGDWLRTIDPRTGALTSCTLCSGTGAALLPLALPLVLTESGTDEDVLSFREPETGTLRGPPKKMEVPE